MARNLPKVRRKDGAKPGVLIALASAIVVLVVAIGVLLAQGSLLDQSPQTDAERDYEFLLAAAQESPDNPGVLMTLAETEFQLGKRDDAIKHGEAAVKLGAEQAGFNERWATLLVMDGRPDDAVPFLEAEIEIDGQGRNAEPHFLLAQIHAKKDDTDAALKSIKAALKIAPVQADMRIVYGEILEQSGDEKAAIAQYKLAMKYLPGDERPIEALNRLGVEVETSETVAPVDHP